MSLRSKILSVVGRYALKNGKFKEFYRKHCASSSEQWGAYLSKWGGFYPVGTGVYINRGCNIGDPAYLKLGSNISLSNCTLLGHDASIRILNNRFGKKLDSVGQIEILDNCFVGSGAIIMPRVKIGPDSLVAAGAVVTKDVPPGVVVGGNPAKVICTTLELVARMEARSNGYPWIDLIKTREGAFDARIEPELVRMRKQFFFENAVCNQDSI